MAISDEATPAIANLVRRSASDFAGSTGAVKAHYFRPRPFVANGAPTCTPEDEESLRDNGSYPSGHAAMGWGVGLVLASIFPERAAQLTARGRAFGESRAICNLHWQSDVAESQVLASAVYARLLSDASFRADLEAAQEEARGLRDATRPDAAACERVVEVLGGR